MGKRPSANIPLRFPPGQTQGPGYFTAKQLKDAWGVTLDRVRSILRQAHDAGQLESMTIRVPTIDGRPLPVPAYRIKAAKKSRKAST